MNKCPQNQMLVEESQARVALLTKRKLKRRKSLISLLCT